MTGIRLPRKKESSLISWTLGTPRAPSRIKLCFHPDSDLRIAPGDKVKVGDFLGSSRDACHQSFRIHSPVNGKIETLRQSSHPLGGSALIADIVTDRKDESSPVWHETEGWMDLSNEQFSARITQAGLVTLDERMLAVDSLLKRMTSVPEIIVSATESEPYITCHQAMVMTHALEIIKGAEVVRRMTGAAKIRFLFEEDQLQAAELIKSKIYFLKWDYCEVEVLPAVYPQKHDLDLRAYSGQDFSKKAVLNVSTIYAIYEAAAKGKPLIERPVTVGGECVIEPRNVWLRFGTTLEEGFKACKGLLRKPEKMLIGGPMRGYEQLDPTTPIVFAGDAILALPKEVLKGGETRECVRCGWCNEVCPSPISPAMILLAAQREDWAGAEDLQISQCVECANCSYICPSNIPVLDWIQEGKNQVQLQSKLK